MFTATAYLIYLVLVILGNAKEITDRNIEVSWNRVFIVFVMFPLPFVIVFGLVEYWV